MLVWLLCVVPAAVITAIRGRWLYFWCGWLTFGILWFIGALAPDPDDPPQKRRAAAIALVAMTVAAVVLGLFGARPSPVLGLDGQALQSSVGNTTLLGLGDDSCDREGDGSWTCSRFDVGFSSTVGYRVRANGMGCWRAERSTPGGEGSPKRLSGCVTLFDFVFG